MRHKGVPTNSLPERQQLHYSSVAFVTDAWQTNLQQPGDQALVTQHYRASAKRAFAIRSSIPGLIAGETP